MMERQTFKKWLALLCMVAAIGFGVAGFVAPPLGEVDGSVLILVAQFLTASGTFLGLDVYYGKFISTINQLKK